jgi:hypothetical protein
MPHLMKEQNVIKASCIVLDPELLNEIISGILMIEPHPFVSYVYYSVYTPTLCPTIYFPVKRNCNAEVILIVWT